MKKQNKTESHVKNLLKDVPRDTKILTVIDGHQLTLSWLGSVLGHKVIPLGVDRFGQTGNIKELEHKNFINNDGRGCDEPLLTHVEQMLSMAEDQIAGYHCSSRHRIIKKDITLLIMAEDRQHGYSYSSWQRITNKDITTHHGRGSPTRI